MSCLIPSFSYLNTHKLYNTCQSAYLSDHSTESALLKVDDQFLSHYKGNISVLALLDFSSAFETNDHPIHVHRLHTDFGFTDTVLQWFSSYLTDCTHYVSLSNHYSAFDPVYSGIPQSSVLGFILFTMYNKPLSAIIDSNSIIHHSYDDDLQLQMTAPPDGISELLHSTHHVYVMSMVGQLRTCLSLMTTRQNSCMSPLVEQSISITYLLQSLLEMLKFTSNSLLRIWILH